MARAMLSAASPDAKAKRLVPSASGCTDHAPGEADLGSPTPATTLYLPLINLARSPSIIVQELEGVMLKWSWPRLTPPARLSSGPRFRYTSASAPTTMKSENPDVKHFAAIPWCAAHLAEPNTVRETANSRFLKPSGEDVVFATVLNTPDTITSFLALYKLPPPSPVGSAPTRVDELKFLITLGTAVGGYPGVCHGGIVATILDEIIGLVFPLNKSRGAIPETSYMTAYLNTTFMKPVRVPATYLCRATVDKVQGRKYFMTGTVEDGEGNVMARGDALYVELKEKL